jgi:hypothetical protein
MRRHAIIFSLAMTFITAAFGQAATLIKEVTKAVSIGVLTTAANASAQSFLETKPTSPTAMDRVKIKEALNRMDSQNPTKRRAAFADRVDYLHYGVVPPEVIFEKRSRLDIIVRQCESIENVEMDPKAQFVVVSYTEIEGYLDSDKSPAGFHLEVTHRFKRVALIGDWKKNPKVYALKDAI